MTRFVLPLAAALLLSACSGSEEANLAQIDNQIAGQDIDPALTSALEDEILVDPALVGQSSPNNVRQPERPLQAPYPQPVRPAAAPAGDDLGIGLCGVPIRYGPEYADRLPAEFPAYPGRRVTEAAGADTGNCHARVVTFATDHDWRQVMGWYRDRAVAAGFNHEQQARDGDQVLAGVNERVNGAYYVIATPREGGTDVAFIVNHGG